MVALALIGSCLVMMALGAAFWFGTIHVGASDRLVGGTLIGAGMLDAVFSLFFMSR